MYIFLKIQSSTVVFVEENSHCQVVHLKTATQHWRYSWDSDFADNYQVENAMLVCTHAKWTFFTPRKLQFVQRDRSSRSFQNLVLLHLVRFFAYNLAMKAHEDTLDRQILVMTWRGWTSRTSSCHMASKICGLFLNWQLLFFWALHRTSSFHTVKLCFSFTVPVSINLLSGFTLRVPSFPSFLKS